MTFSTLVRTIPGMKPHCRKCVVELVPTNWHPSRMRRNNRICITCSLEADRQYKRTHKAKVKLQKGRAAIRRALGPDRAKTEKKIRLLRAEADRLERLMVS